VNFKHQAVTPAETRVSSRLLSSIQFCVDLATYMHQNASINPINRCQHAQSIILFKFYGYFISKLNFHLGLGIFTFPISSLSSLFSLLVGTRRAERLMLITAHQQVLSCVQGQRLLNLTAPIRPAIRKQSLFHRPLG